MRHPFGVQVLLYRRLRRRTGGSEHRQNALSFDELERGITNKDVTFADFCSDLKFDAERMNVRLRLFGALIALGAGATAVVIALLLLRTVFA